MIRRRRSGFAPLGILRADQLEIPDKRARELAINRAWQEAAGEAIVRRTKVVGVRRGVLEIEVLAEEAWTATLIELVPRLAGRLSAAHPELGVKRFRIRRVGAARAQPAETIVLPEPGESGESTASASVERSRERESGAANDESSWSTRLPELMRRYIESRRSVDQ